jgi:hypothetical protein
MVRRERSAIVSDANTLCAATFGHGGASHARCYESGAAPIPLHRNELGDCGQGCCRGTNVWRAAGRSLGSATNRIGTGISCVVQVNRNATVWSYATSRARAAMALDARGSNIPPAVRSQSSHVAVEGWVGVSVWVWCNGKHRCYTP